MNELSLELIALLVLLLANGFFAMSEIAVVVSRRAKLKQLAEAGSQAALKALTLAQSPGRFLSAVQVGITLIGVLLGALGGARLADELAVYLTAIPYVSTYAHTVSFVIVIAAITYLSVILGELVPKQIALANPEGIATGIAPVMTRFTALAKPLVDLLDYSGGAILRLLGIKPAEETRVSDDELRILLDQGLHTGVFNREEKKMVEGVLELDELAVRDIMTPKSQVVYLNIEDSDEHNWRRIAASGHSHFPVYQNNRDNVTGVVSIKALWANLSLAGKAELKPLITAPLIVPASMPAPSLIREFKKSGRHLALVVDEYGATEGLVTLNDFMEAIVGELHEKEHRRPQARRREDGTWMVDAQIDVTDAREKIGFPELLPGEEDGEFQTLAGYILHERKQVPVEGEKFHWQGWVFEVADMDRHRIDKILILPPKA